DAAYLREATLLLGAGLGATLSRPSFNTCRSSRDSRSCLESSTASYPTRCVAGLWPAGLLDRTDEGVASDFVVPLGIWQT
ncbi:MAG TPA: hypothetical protein VJ625_14070, partial [Propionibacteriaceae bacterium]|nr:hypothetical protein [Propionibacteriaceae bacterium]